MAPLSFSARAGLCGAGKQTSSDNLYLSVEVSLRLVAPVFALTLTDRSPLTMTSVIATAKIVGMVCLVSRADLSVLHAAGYASGVTAVEGELVVCAIAPIENDARRQIENRARLIQRFLSRRTSQ